MFWGYFMVGLLWNISHRTWVHLSGAAGRKTYTSHMVVFWYGVALTANAATRSYFLFCSCVYTNTSFISWWLHIKPDLFVFLTELRTKDYMQRYCDAPGARLPYKLMSHLIICVFTVGHKRLYTQEVLSGHWCESTYSWGANKINEFVSLYWESAPRCIQSMQRL